MGVGINVDDEDELQEHDVATGCVGLHTDVVVGDMVGAEVDGCTPIIKNRDGQCNITFIQYS